MVAPEDVIQRDPHEVFDIELEEDLLEANRRIAEENHRILQQNNVKAIDVMGSVGSGKTSLIERLVEALKHRYRIFALGGDVATTIDSERIARHGVPVTQINTGKECHLDANLVKKALNRIDLKRIDLLFIENVGNLICPADFPLGSDKRVVVISVTEGPYMVVKHPFIFAEADLVVINKIDLAKVMEIDPLKLEEDVKKISPHCKVVKTSCKTGEGINSVASSLDLHTDLR